MNERRSLSVYLLLIVWCLIALFAGRIMLSRGVPLRLFDGEALAVVCLGFFAVPYQQLAGLPSLTDYRVNWRLRYLAPFAMGLSFAIVDVVVFRYVLHPAPSSRLPGFLQPFPYSALYFVADAVYVEVIYRLLPFTLILSLTGHLQLKAGRTPIAFWIVAIVTSLAAPYQLIVKGPVQLMVTLYTLHFVFNMIQALFYKNAGLLASLCMRLGHYLLWYILLGICLQWKF